MIVFDHISVNLWTNFLTGSFYASDEWPWLCSNPNPFACHILMWPVYVLIIMEIEILILF